MAAAASARRQMGHPPAGMKVEAAMCSETPDACRRGAFDFHPGSVFTLFCSWVGSEPQTVGGAAALLCPEAALSDVLQVFQPAEISSARLALPAAQTQRSGSLVFCFGNRFSLQSQTWPFHSRPSGTGGSSRPVNPGQPPPLQH